MGEYNGSEVSKEMIDELVDELIASGQARHRGEALEMVSKGVTSLTPPKTSNVVARIYKPGEVETDDLKNVKGKVIVTPQNVAVKPSKPGDFPPTKR